MAKSRVKSGICGFVTTIEAVADGDRCAIAFESDCPNMSRLAQELRHVELFDEISYRGGRPATFQAAERCLPHTACPVPCGVIKAVEVECGLALPADACIEVSKE